MHSNAIEDIPGDRQSVTGKQEDLIRFGCHFLGNNIYARTTVKKFHYLRTNGSLHFLNVVYFLLIYYTVT